jgi:hypothetical protein
MASAPKAPGGISSLEGGSSILAVMATEVSISDRLRPTAAASMAEAGLLVRELASIAALSCSRSATLLTCSAKTLLQPDPAQLGDLAPNQVGKLAPSRCTHAQSEISAYSKRDMVRSASSLASGNTILSSSRKNLPAGIAMLCVPSPRKPPAPTIA